MRRARTDGAHGNLGFCASTRAGHPRTLGTRVNSASAAARDVAWARTIDLLERSFVVTLFSWFTYRMADSIIKHWSEQVAFIWFIELTVVLFIVFRRFPKMVTTSPWDWTLTILASSTPLLVTPPLLATSGGAEALLPERVCTALMLFGFLFQWSAKMTLGRSYGILPANRGVKTRGPYAFVRHPIYLGYTITHIGFLLYAPNLWNVTVYAAGFVFQVLRIFAEERLLARDEAYRDFSRAVPYRLIPGVF
jgi:protein-S-isoprenylcysteine O-methyltransferase Ste14